MAKPKPKITLEARVIRMDRSLVRIERKIDALGAALMEFFLQSDITPHREPGKTPYVVRILDTEFNQIDLDEE